MSADLSRNVGDYQALRMHRANLQKPVLNVNGKYVESTGQKQAVSCIDDNPIQPSGLEASQIKTMLISSDAGARRTLH